MYFEPPKVIEGSLDDPVLTVHNAGCTSNPQAVPPCVDVYSDLHPAT